MNNEIKMNVSLLTTSGDKRVIYVVFTDGDKSAELMLPEVSVVSNKGFTDEEIGQLKDYVANQQDEIYKIAKEINPIKAMMKKD